MLMEAKNQIKVIMLSVKYNIMRQMVNKVTFITNILFMILNNATFIIQWLVLFRLKDEIGGYTIKEVILLGILTILSILGDCMLLKNNVLRKFLVENVTLN